MWNTSLIRSVLFLACFRIVISSQRGRYCFAKACSVQWPISLSLLIWLMSGVLSDGSLGSYWFPLCTPGCSCKPLKWPCHIQYTDGVLEGSGNQTRPTAQKSRSGLQDPVQLRPGVHKGNEEYPGDPSERTPGSNQTRRDSEVGHVHCTEHTRAKQHCSLRDEITILDQARNNNTLL